MEIDMVAIAVSVVSAAICGAIGEAMTGKPYMFAVNFALCQAVYWASNAYRNRRKKA